MRKYAVIIIGAVVAIAAVLVIQQRKPMTISETVTSPHHQQDEFVRGKVLETMDAGDYTYVHVDTGDEEIWAAGPRTPVEVGSEIAFPPGMPMPDFHSDTLDRTFATLYFISEIITGDAVDQPHMTHPPMSPPDIDDMDFTGIELPEGGKRIADLYAEKSSLAYNEVVVRGKVVKFTGDVMQKNWIHLRDGTGEEGTNDLTVTSQTQVDVGDVVLVKGVLSIDKDFGYGYSYELLVEDADVTVE